MLFSLLGIPEKFLVKAKSQHLREVFPQHRKQLTYSSVLPSPFYIACHVLGMMGNQWVYKNDKFPPLSVKKLILDRTRNWSLQNIYII